jgi:hypothetical protein
MFVSAKELFLGATLKIGQKKSLKRMDFGANFFERKGSKNWFYCKAIVLDRYIIGSKGIYSILIFV